MSLSLKAVDRIFERLTITYGRDFSSKFEGLDMNAIKSSWAFELAGFEHCLDMVAWGLDNLPERAPNVIQFRTLCRSAPRKEAPALPAPSKGDPVIAKMIADGFKAKQTETVDHKAWARKILAEHKAGIRRTPTVLMMANNALKG